MSPISKALLVAGGAIGCLTFVASYAGMLPLRMSDFSFLLVLAVLAAAYRPGWVFLLLVAVLPIETVNFAPISLGFDIRPYQFLTVAIYVGLSVRALARRPLPKLIRLNAADMLISLVSLGSLPAAVNAADPAASLRLSLVLFSFLAVYGLFRIYIRSSEDVGRILPFVILSMLLTAFSAIVQNLLFLGGYDSTEVMPGRPNGPFAEPDWLGMFLSLAISLCLAAGYLIGTRSTSFREAFRTKRSLLMSAALFLCCTALILSVSRSAWLGVAASVLLTALLPLLVRRPLGSLVPVVAFGSAAALSLAIVLLVPLTRFDLSGRAESIGTGRQEITVSCEHETSFSGSGADMEAIGAAGCRHINLEEIVAERDAGRFVTVTTREDPNIAIRRDIHERTVSLAREHPVLGIGWGTVSSFLGHDERGAGLNASNVFLEVWLGSGLLGLIGLSGFLLLAFRKSAADFFRSHGTFPLFLLTAVIGMLVFNLFNSGILLGFIWALFGIIGSYLSRGTDFAETL